MTPNKEKQIKLLFEFDSAAKNGEHLLFTNPVDIISADDIDEVISALQKVQEQVDSGFHAAGFISYEAAPAFDAAMKVCPKGKLPLLWFGIFEQPQILTQEHQYQYDSYQIGAWTPNVSKDKFDENIAAIKEEIFEGNTYQVNYTIRLDASFSGDDFAYFKQLSRNQQGQYAAYLDIGDFSILSASPESFFHWQDHIITAKPMKGTIERGLTYLDDEEKKNELFLSQKNRAENVMIVDLLRNDLGKTAVFNTVRVPKLFETEKYPTVWQMTSTVQADSLPNTNIVDIFTALFPCGSVTGAPKLSTMDIIAKLEQTPRGAYCGAIGYLTPKGEANFSVPIRTVTIDKEQEIAEYGVGGGITWDSTSDDEYNEVLTKAALLNEEIKDFSLLETLLLEDDQYKYLERHLRRLADSAAYFAYPLDIQSIKQALDAHATDYPQQARRVRLVVNKQGHLHIESVPYQKLDSDTPQIVALAKQPINKLDRYLYHKTTNRSVYDAATDSLPKYFDILLWNEDKQITEFTIGNIVAQINGQKITPPISSGLLPGVLRQELIEIGEISEHIITTADLAKAENIWLINSVRGWVNVKLSNI